MIKGILMVVALLPFALGVAATILLVIRPDVIAGHEKDLWWAAFLGLVPVALVAANEALGWLNRKVTGEK